MVEEIELCPTMAGFPVRRTRQYALCIHKSCVPVPKLLLYYKLQVFGLFVNY